jgi:glutathione S-transferase
MSTTVWESFHLRAPIDRVWPLVRPATFAYLPTVADADTKDAHTEVGGSRTVRYKDGTVQTLRITHLSELDHSIGWDLVSSAPATTFSAQSHTVRLRTVTETSSTFIEWTTQFSADASQEVLQDAKFKQIDNFTAIANALGVPPTQPRLCLTYFNARGRAEVSRLLLAQAGLAYDDNRLTREQWLAKKPSAPFGQLPLLSVDSKTFAQSHSIERYIARLGGLAGANSFEWALIDAVQQAIKDAVPSFISAVSPFENKTEEEKVPKIAAFFGPKGDWAKWTPYFNKALASNKGGAGWLVGSKVSYADISLYAWYEMVLKVNPSALTEYPLLASWYQRVVALPRIAAWIKSRPPTPF